MALALPLALALLSAAPQAIDLHAAAQAFADAKQDCARDAGKLWGAPLCSPILIVDPQTRAVVASQADTEGALTRKGQVFVGTLPEDQNAANTSAKWSGVFWTELLWPLPSKPVDRQVLLLHEMFHHAQDALGLRAEAADNPQLDTEEGRVLMRLEWAALERALVLAGPGEHRAIADALIFRARRQQLFPNAAMSELALERNEGLAEYTGVELAFRNAELRVRYAIKDLHRIARQPSYVRSFAYATGPAVGLLLDRHDPKWRQAMRHGTPPEALLAEAIRWRPPADLAATVARRSGSYHGAKIRAEEQAREKRRQAEEAQLRAALLEKPTLELPLLHMSMAFNPNRVVPLGDAGTVYPTLRLVDEWGVLEVKKAALISKDLHTVRVGAPTSTTPPKLEGDGWTLELNPGWSLAPKGKGFAVEKAPAQGK
jgi:hypothetical protein